MLHTIHTRTQSCLLQARATYCCAALLASIHPAAHRPRFVTSLLSPYRTQAMFRHYSTLTLPHTGHVSSLCSSSPPPAPTPRFLTLLILAYPPAHSPQFVTVHRRPAHITCTLFVFRASLRLRETETKAKFAMKAMKNKGRMRLCTNREALCTNRDATMYE